jgi:hypothetical protein
MNVCCEDASSSFGNADNNPSMRTRDNSTNCRDISAAKCTLSTFDVFFFFNVIFFFVCELQRTFAGLGDHSGSQYNLSTKK